MSFIDEIKGTFNGFNLPVEYPYRAVLFGDNGGFFENVKSIRSYSKEEIVLTLKKGELKIVGEDLYIKKYSLGDIVICGKIKVIERS